MMVDTIKYRYCIPMTMPSIMLKNVCLDYHQPSNLNSLGKIAMHYGKRILGQPSIHLKKQTYRALHHINLTLKAGDRIGIIGKNGAGKSSLLRVLARIYHPQSGIAMIQGKIATIFDLNFGMNLEMSGYDNIVNLSVLKGCPKKKFPAFLEDIETFTALGQHLHQPLKTFSQGMQMKLAFAVATALEADILLIDEIIGVGDAFFMKQATNRLNHMAQKSSVMVLTSHSNEIIKQFCQQAIVLKEGTLQYIGPVDQAIEFYEASEMN